MDSLTQIVLGAAVGEVVLGKKVGNRAMLFGAIGGTIPDLDVLANFVADDMTALAFHRAISHSFFFALTAPFLFGWLTERFYKSGLYKNKVYRLSMVLLWMVLLGLITTAVNFVPYASSGGFSIPTLLISIGLLVFMGWHYWTNFYKSDPDLKVMDITWKQWAWLFFWSIFTHPLLDSCTTYGTQLFQPFSDYRVAFNNVAVADPFYTVPFLICVVVARILTRNTPARKIVNWVGIIVSSLYLVWTVNNKFKVNRVFENSFSERNITYNRYMTSPTIFSNFLWNGVAEGDTAFYMGMYSLLDKEPRLQEMQVFPKNHHLIKGHEKDKSIQTLRWFCKDYYVYTEKNDTLYFNDLRFGIRGMDKDNHPQFIFSFQLLEEDGELVGHENPDVPEDPLNEFEKLFERTKGLD
ncbi:MAG: inner membrane protein [Maribacter sp.]|jgi:inner membrane protein